MTKLEKIIYDAVNKTCGDYDCDDCKKDAERVAAAVLPLIDGVITAKDKEIEQLREALENLALAVKHDASDLVVRTRTNTAFEVLAQNAQTEPFTGPVVGIEDGTEFNNAR
jgi:hypothetical protein